MNQSDSMKTSDADPPVLATIAIPAYNRPDGLARLLDSIDAPADRFEVLICEDGSPGRRQIRSVVEDVVKNVGLKIRYHENPKNLGFDGNIRKLLRLAKGRFTILMGDDDFFLEGELAGYLDFLENQGEVGYVLRSYVGQTPDGQVEVFKYLENDKHFAPGSETAAWMFKRSVSLAGFTIASELAQSLESDIVDGSLLYQVFVMSRAVLRRNSVYCSTPFAVAHQSFREGTMNFGVAESERQLFTPGQITPEASIQFTLGFVRVARALDELEGSQIAPLLAIDLSKYSYPFLSIQRKRGVAEFVRYSRDLHAQANLGITWHYWFYVAALLLLGEDRCDAGIRRLKRIMGRTPAL